MTPSPPCVELVCKPPCRLAEGPLWNAAEGRLYFNDISQCRIWRCDPGAKNAEVYWQGARQVGGFAFSRRNGLLLCAGHEVGRLDHGRTWETLHTFDFAEGERFNDITTDPDGRVYAGTANTRGGLGRLVLLEAGRPPRHLLDAVNLSNGMGFSPDENVFYHAVTKDCVVNVYEYDRKSGGISNPRALLSTAATAEWPDGLTVDSEGCLWVAFWTGGVKRVSPDGELLDTIEVPAEHPTSVAFGGERLDELFITTATDGLFRLEPGVRGRVQWPSNL